MYKPQNPPSPTDHRWVGIASAATYAGVSTKTVRRWISSGNIAGYRVGPRLIRVDLAEVERMMRPIPTIDGAAVA
ncbi:hypothetical protein PROP_03136 [Propionicimonas sp. T2.31MG-18]|uniref:helix-turn-helix domain-containing protein n=1 Tax=Propionicimonas sp. T2.31MG-18 TaxID=3157620 RepID=UPI0035EAF844